MPLRTKLGAAIVLALALVGSVALLHHRSTRGGNLIALDASTGRQVWRSHVPATGILRVSDADGAMKVAAWTEFSHCDFGENDFTVDSKTGQVLGTPLRAKDIPDGRQLDDGAVRYLALFTPGVDIPGEYTPSSLAITATDQPGGQLRWRRTLKGIGGTLPDMSAGSGVLVLGDPDLSGFSVLDARSGKTLWSSKAPLTRAVPDGEHHRLYLVSRGQVQAVDSRTGAPQWRASAGARKNSGRLVPQVAANAELVAVEQGDRLGVYDHDGNRQYTTALPESSDLSLFVGQHHIYVGLGDISAGSGCD